MKAAALLLAVISGLCLIALNARKWLLKLELRQLEREIDIARHEDTNFLFGDTYLYMLLDEHDELTTKLEALK